MKNSKGSLSVEALFSVSVFFLVILLLISIFSIFSTEEIMNQYTYDLIEEIEISNYMFEKIGFSDVEIYKEKIESYLEDIPFDSEMFIEYLDISKTLASKGKNIFLKSIFRNKLNDKLYDLKRINIKDYSFSLVGDNLYINYSYDINLPFSLSIEINHMINKSLWLFGDEAEIYPNTTLASVLNDENEKEKEIPVYKTKTGTKYHFANCFYLIKKGTDKSKIISMTLKLAKEKYKLTPCLRCIKGIIRWK